jgi:phosphopantetheinyl transferase
MPLVYQQNINLYTKLGVWHITEAEIFFLQKVQVQRSITHLNKRLQHLAGRYLLQDLFPNFPHHLILVAETRKPFLTDDPFHFSISHCNSYAAAIVSTQNRVGVDVEVVSEKPVLLQHKFLSLSECLLVEKILANHPSLSLAQLITCTWSIKEALFKWYGAGGIDFKQHLVISDIAIDDNAGYAHCIFTKEQPIYLKVSFIFFNNNCVCWLVQ